MKSWSYKHVQEHIWNVTAVMSVEMLLDQVDLVNLKLS